MRLSFLRPLAQPPPADPLTSAPAPDGASVEGVAAHEPRNFLVLTVYQVIIRTGWIFKTESIVMPAVLDSLGGGAWLRGCLPLLNRFGQSIPPLMAARRIGALQQKKWALVGYTGLMSLAFLGLAGVWFAAESVPSGWLPAIFLAIYTMFFAATGINQLTLNTLQGKLIRTTQRGRLLLVGNVVGSATAIACAWWLMPRWLGAYDAEFNKIFAFTGGCFALAAVGSVLLAEPRDYFEEAPTRFTRIFSDAWDILRSDPTFGRLAIISSLFGTSMLLFPHYQALGRGERVGSTMNDLMYWVVVQNAGTALFSMVAGPLADRYGNRLVLRLVMVGVCGAPLLALLLWYTDYKSQLFFPLVFVLVGLTPVGIRIFNNYALEICEPIQHTRYLSTLNVCSSVPIFLSPLAGTLIDWWGFAPIFLLVTGLMLWGWVLTSGLVEPRHK